MPAPETRPAPSERFVARLARGIGYIVTGRPQDWFGPLEPTPPQAPPEVAGRQFDYPSGFNLNLAPRAYEPVTFADLRALADAYDLVRIITAVLDDHSKRATGMAQSGEEGR